MAWVNVELLLNDLNFSISFLYKLAISISDGSSGLGSVNNDDIDNNNFVIVRAGLQACPSI